MVDNKYSNEENTTKVNSKIKVPKNIRQIGKISGKLKIYVEDYVKTYARQLAEGDYTERCVAVLIGEYVHNEIEKSVFIYGAIDVKDAYIDGKVKFNEEIWTKIYENIKKYFPEGEIVGWYYGGTGFGTEDGDMIKQVHIDNFSGRDKVLLTYDILEKEENFYLFESGNISLQSGYYVYYEKNLEMQAYMVEHKETSVEEAKVDDHAIREIRSILNEKKNPKKDKNKEQKSMMRLVYATGGLLTLVVVVVGASVLYNNNRIEDIQTSLSKLGVKDSNESKNSSNSEEASDNIFEQIDARGDDTSVEVSANVDLEKDKSDDRTSKDNSTNNAGDSIAETEKGEQQAQTDQMQSGDSIAQVTAEPVVTTEATIDQTKEEVKEVTPTEAVASAVTESPTPTAVESSVTTSSNASKIANYKEYVVKKGDTLASVCFELYGDYKNLKIVKELNQLEDENKIYIGQKLLVP